MAWQRIKFRNSFRNTYENSAEWWQAALDNHGAKMGVMRPKKRTTPEKRARIVELRAKNPDLSTDAIATRMGIGAER